MATSQTAGAASENVAFEIANELGLSHWDGACLELVDHILHRFPAGRTLWIDLINHPEWRYHAVLVLDGIVHDAWHPDVMLPPDEYVRSVFGKHAASWEIVQ